MDCRRLSLLLVVALVSFVGRATAQDGRERALELARQSHALYDLGSFDDAAELLVQAYGVHPEPTLLYNLARAYESGGRLGEAIDTYDRYLREARGIHDRAAIRARIETLRAQQHAIEASAHTEHAEHPAARPVRAETRAHAAEAPARSVDPVPWAIAGIGVVGIGGGLLLAWLAEDAHATAIVDPIQASALDHQQHAYDLATAGNFTLALSGIVILLGVVWGIVDVASSSGSRSQARRAPLTIEF